MFRKYIKEETQFLVDMFVENRHKRIFLQGSCISGKPGKTGKPYQI